jgi:hypothetical protein
MSFEFESVNHSFQEASQDPELQHRSQLDTSGELADGELDERDLEAINGGVRRCPPGDKDDGIGESIGAGIDRTVKKVWDWIF